MSEPDSDALAAIAEIARLRADNIDWARQNLQNVRNEVNRDVNKAMADEIERLRSWMYEAINSAADPQDACDHNDSEVEALRATLDEVIGKLRTGLKEAPDHQGEAPEEQGAA